MSAQKQLQLDSTHCRAICDEIGERMRVFLGRDLPAASPRLQSLIDRLSELDHQPAPSIAPSVEDMIWQPVAIGRSHETAHGGVRRSI
jgi:hypothetical protein